MRVDVDLVVHAKIGKFILIQLSFLLLLNFILDTIELFGQNGYTEDKTSACHSYGLQM